MLDVDADKHYLWTPQWDACLAAFAVCRRHGTEHVGALYLKKWLADVAGKGET